MRTTLTPEKILAKADALLVEQHGQRKWRRSGDGVEVLVRTILSQSTNHANSSAAYENLRKRYPTWEEVAEQPLLHIMRVIHVGGLAEQKANYIGKALRAIRADRKRIDLEFLGEMPFEAARQYLLCLEGVGPKTADCVLLFAFNMPAFPVDTHVHRMARRLGLMKRGSTPEMTHDVITPLIPPARRYAMHLLMIEHGRTICRVREQCEACKLLKICHQGQRKMTSAPIWHSAAWRRRHA